MRNHTFKYSWILDILRPCDGEGDVSIYSCYSCHFSSSWHNWRQYIAFLIQHKSFRCWTKQLFPRYTDQTTYMQVWTANKHWDDQILPVEWKMMSGINLMQWSGILGNKLQLAFQLARERGRTQPAVLLNCSQFA